MADETLKEKNDKLTENVDLTDKIIETKHKTCFVIMPITDPDGYEKGHFQRVYDYLIKPACKEAGFKPIRADDGTASNHIIIEILKQILDADMAICDLSSRNANVFYELAIRHAFDKPVTLIKDEKIPSAPFDIQTLRYISYDSKMRVDEIKNSIPQIAQSLLSTYKDKTEKTDSVVYLLGIQPAQTVKTEISGETNLILENMQALTNKVDRLHNNLAGNSFTNIDSRNFPFSIPNLEFMQNLPYPGQTSSSTSSIQFIYTDEYTDADIEALKSFVEKTMRSSIESTEVIEQYNDVNKNNYKILKISFSTGVPIRSITALIELMKSKLINVPVWGAGV